ncbi:bifunctional DNA primase/polymerase [Agrococcus sp. SL85]|uniref:bifunctional DNA primase/polymerase n=1 Tax=Agrococcus sp. SL85 TaxID=2995141 RepID=UPI00226CFD00|nr:bifunctional DNA primase/polymerase [Agrococcus sp. SL85]WAC67470.1 bifunctional DNA primase/polymerase [Agrococcus sp. SL85]
MTAETPANPILDAALDLLAHGYSIVPIRADASKAPALASWRHYTAQRATPDTVRAWFADGGHDLGVVQGAISGGAELTELEGRAAHRLPELRELAYASGLGDVWDAITRGWVEMSPSGGWHFHYRVTGIDVPGNLKLARNADREVLAETRGEGGQVVVAPSTRHATGQPWRRIVGSPATAPTITAEERAALHELLRTLDEQPEQPAPAPRPASTADRQGSGDRLKPGDDYEARTDWADILEPHGWTLVYTQGRTRYWRRPGKNIGISATTGHAEDRDRLYVFTSSTEFQTETPYTKFGAYAVLDHHGDHAAAARELGRTGYGDKPQLAEVIHLTHANLADAVAAETPADVDEPQQTQPVAEAPGPAAPVDPLEQRISEEAARLLIQREARKRVEQLDAAATPPTPAWIDPTDHLDGTYAPPQPTIGTHLPGGLPILYPSAVNGLVGDPEAAKTLLATAIAIDTLHGGGTVAWIDLDHNGAPATIARFRRFGATKTQLGNPDTFRLGLPEDAAAADAIVADLVARPASLVVLDSIGELLPLYGASSNDADEYTRVHQQVMARIATAGAAVLTIDHLSKGTDSRTYGASGTIAKKRAYDGALIRVTVETSFAPGKGGQSELRIIKDRHGALRALADGGREPMLARFVLDERENSATRWHLAGPGLTIGDAIADVDAVAALDPPARSYRDIKHRLGWADRRSQDAWRSYKALSEGGES